MTRPRVSWAIPFLLMLVAACGRGELPPSSGAGEGGAPVQGPPSDTAELFAPGVVSTGMYERDLAISPEGDLLYFTIQGPGFELSTIMTSTLAGGRWAPPEVAPFSGGYRDLEPAFSPDGRRLFFVSFRPDDQAGDPSEETDIWAVDREGSGWGDPYRLGSPINTDDEEFFPSVTAGGALYFTRRLADGDEAIYRAALGEGGYETPVRLGPEVNAGRARFNAFVDPQERFLIVPIFGREDSLGGTDYYASFRSGDGSWAGPVHLGDRVNSASPLEYSASLGPDGRTLFFMSARGKYKGSRLEPRLTAGGLRRVLDGPENGNPDIYRIDAGFIESLRP